MVEVSPQQERKVKEVIDNEMQGAWGIIDSKEAREVIDSMIQEEVIDSEMQEDRRITDRKMRKVEEVIDIKMQEDEEVKDSR